MCGFTNTAAARRPYMLSYLGIDSLRKNHWYRRRRASRRASL